MPKGNIPHLYSYDRKEEVGTVIPLMNKPYVFLPPVEEELFKGIHNIQTLGQRGLRLDKARSLGPVALDLGPPWG